MLVIRSAQHFDTFNLVPCIPPLHNSLSYHQLPCQCSCWNAKARASGPLTPAPLHAVLSSRSEMQVYSAGLDNNITVWDLRKGAESMTLKGHTDSITGLALDPDGTHLLSNAADNSLRVWDLRPYAPANRCEKIFTGHQHNYERNLLRCSWSSDGSKVCLCPSR